MIEVITRSFGISDRDKKISTRNDHKAVRKDSKPPANKRVGERDLFDLARSIDFRARRRRIRSAGII